MIQKLIWCDGDGDWWNIKKWTKYEFEAKCFLYVCPAELFLVWWQIWLGTNIKKWMKNLLWTLTAQNEPLLLFGLNELQTHEMEPQSHINKTYDTTKQHFCDDGGQQFLQTWHCDCNIASESANSRPTLGDETSTQMLATNDTWRKKIEMVYFCQRIFSFCVMKYIDGINN